MNMLLTPTSYQILLASGIGIITYAGLAGEDVWKEFYQYCRESKFVSSDSTFQIVTYACSVFLFIVISFGNAIYFSNVAMLVFNQQLLVY
jgi:Mn2+/Fe2+ NRAMP family transporter